jgi:pyruvate dehydrogenase E2 component (dihydrolipoamide acetyltransferase)
VPHSYATREINLGALSSLRKQLNAQLEDASKLSVTDFLMRASALALKIVPEANAQFDAKTGQANLLPNIDISLAVALDAGLITPIVVSADKKGLSKISSETKDLVTRARSNRLKPHEYQGGTFSISNLGMYGISEFTAVINPPQAMILAVGGPISGATFDEASQAPKASTSLRVSLSYDARAISTDVAFKWLDTFEEILNNPQRMML